MLGSRLSKLGVDDGLDAAGPRRHHRDAVGEIDRLLHVVGDEDHGLGRALPDAAAARSASGCGSAHRARRTARPSAGCSGSKASVRAIAVRCFMPPDSCDGIAVLEAVQADEIDEGLRALLALRARQALPLEAVENVAAHRLPRETARNAGTRCRDRARARRPACRRPGCCRSRSAESRRPDRARSTCRSRTGPSRARNSRGRTSSDTSSSASTGRPRGGR